MSDTDKKILEAALDLFAAQGFHGTSIREIAERVGIQKSSIYNHFSSKDDILEKLFSTYEPASSIKNEFIQKNLVDKINNLDFFFQFIKERVKIEIKNERHQKLLQIMMREHSSEVVIKNIKERLIKGNLETSKMVFQRLMEKGIIKEMDVEFLVYEYIGPLFLIRLMILFVDERDFSEDRLNAFLEHHFLVMKQVLSKN